jgi:polyisoprenoid-binding protein YceI
MSSTASTASPAVPTSASSVWNIDPAHSVAEFKVRHMMISHVKGKFSGLSGVLELDEADYTHSTVEVPIPAASVSTVDDSLDAHLKQFPKLTFRSTSIPFSGGRDYTVSGDLTIRGVTKSVTLNVERRERAFQGSQAWSNRCLLRHKVKRRRLSSEPRSRQLHGSASLHGP